MTERKERERMEGKALPLNRPDELSSLEMSEEDAAFFELGFLYAQMRELSPTEGAKARIHKRTLPLLRRLARSMGRGCFVVQEEEGGVADVFVGPYWS